MEIIKNLKIEKMVYRGYGLGFYKSSPIFVKNCVAGDLLDVQIVHRKKDVKFAEVKRIVQAAPARIESGCEVFGTCGGCDWLQIDYPSQVKFKEDIIIEIFNRLHSQIDPIQVSPDIFNYRNKMFLPVSMRNGKPFAGMFAKLSHRVVAHKSCKLQPIFFDDLVKDVLKYMEAAKVTVYDERTQKGLIRHIGIRYSFSTKELMLILVTRSRKLPFTKQLVNLITEKYPNIKGIIQNINSANTNVILGDDEKILFGQNFITEELGLMKYKIHYKSFFQVNSRLTEKLYKFVKNLIQSGDKVIDAFSGAGTIGLYLADKAKWVYCIESNKNADADAHFNADMNDIKNCNFICGKVEEVLPELAKKEAPDVIVFDPPRKGLEAETIEKIVLIPKIIYISCNPMTQERDVKRLMKQGYTITLIKPFDMFPHTYHMENLIVLERN